MDDSSNPLIVDFLAWLAVKPRRYSDAMEAWRTSCPRLTIWEDAVDRGLVARRSAADRGPMVELTARGRDFLAARRLEPDAVMSNRHDR
jgi:hypothetical protein